MTACWDRECPRAVPARRRPGPTRHRRYPPAPAAVAVSTRVPHQRQSTLPPDSRQRRFRLRIPTDLPASRRTGQPRLQGRRTRRNRRCPRPAPGVAPRPGQPRRARRRDTRTPATCPPAGTVGGIVRRAAELEPAVRGNGVVDGQDLEGTRPVPGMVEKSRAGEGPRPDADRNELGARAWRRRPGPAGTGGRPQDPAMGQQRQGGMTQLLWPAARWCCGGAAVPGMLDLPVSG